MMEQKTIHDYFTPRAAGSTPEAQAPSYAWASGSLESNPVNGTETESDESSDENTYLDSSQKKSTKFVPMNLFKFKPYPAQTAEKTITQFIDKLTRSCDRKRKATEENVSEGHGLKKRRIGPNQTQNDNIIGEAERGRGCGRSDSRRMENEDGNEEDVDYVDGGRDFENEMDGDGGESMDEERLSDNEGGLEIEDEGSDSDGGGKSENEEEDGKATMFIPKEFPLADDTQRDILLHPSKFKLKLYGVSTPSSSQMIRAVSEITNGRMLFWDNKNQSFLLFFYREHNNEGPEIYVMTSGQGYRMVEKRACARFPAKIAKRILKFKSIEIVTRDVAGDTSQTSKLYLPGSEGTVNIWDLITAIVNKFSAFPKDNSSMYNLKCFQNGKGQPKQVKLSIREKSVMVNQSTSVKDLLDIVNHFADIDQCKPTYFWKEKGSEEGEDEEEKDDPQFDQMHYIKEETSRSAIRTLNQNLDKRIQRLLSGSEENDDLTLSLLDMREFVNAEKYVLFMTKKRKPIKIWSGKPPMFSDILKEVQRQLRFKKRSITWEWLKQKVKISLQESKGRRYPVTKFLVGYICSSQPYFLWHGKWLKIRMEYQEMINKNFRLILDENTINADVMFPLSWENLNSKTCKSPKGKSQQNKNADESKSVFKLEEFTSFFNSLGYSTWTDDQARKMLKMLGKYEEVNGCCKYTPDDYGVELNQKQTDNSGSDLSKDESDDTGAEMEVDNPDDSKDSDQAKTVAFAKIFLRLHATIDEFTFNKTYLLLDYVLRQKNHEKRFIVGDRLLSHQIELFDVLAYNNKETYLVHVKTGFDHHVREVCAQVRTSADQLFNDLIANKSHKILDQWWENIHKAIDEKKSMAKYKKAVQDSCVKLGMKGFNDLFKEPRGITFVIAVKDTRKDTSALRNDQGCTETLENCIKKAIGDRFRFVLKKIKEMKYVDKNTGYVRRDKFEREARKQQFVNEMSSSISSRPTKRKRSGDPKVETTSGGSEEEEEKDDEDARKHKLSNNDWEKVFDALRKGLPQTKSTVVRMELLHLFSYFRKFQISGRKFQLKICFIPDSKENLAQDLKSFIEK